MDSRADRWARIEDAYHRARECHPEQRSRVLSEACGSDALMRAQVETLLSQDARTNSLLGAPEIDSMPVWTAAGGEPIAPGTRIGVYEIVEPVGSGGMGDVYRAYDSSLHRHAALKLLPALVDANSELFSRFEREARALAALNHPNIAQVYGLEKSGHACAIAMEFVDGETLLERLAHGPIPVAEALRIAKEMAEGLEAAHDQGIVHRDLKPANVKITPRGRVKLLDFGLAKTRTAVRSVEVAGWSDVGSATTGAGVILGTPAYMAPEQARGAATDHRSDIFAFGCVLYEMVTGRQAFQGETAFDVMAAVLAREPDLGNLPSATHPQLRPLVGRCLEKEVRRRWQAIGDVRVELEMIQQDPYGRDVLTVVRADRRWKLATAAIASLLASLMSTAAMWNLRQSRPAALAKLSFPLPDGLRFTRGGRHVVAVSPDGLRVALVANDRINLRSLDEEEVHPLAGTEEDASEPVFSRDGRWIAYWSGLDRKLKKVAAAGGVPIAIAEVDNPLGASWTSDDLILIGQGPQGIARVAGNGGGAKTIVSVGPGQIAFSPQMLPDGDTVLFGLGTGVLGPPLEVDWDRAEIVAQSLKSGARRVLVQGGRDARYVPTGHLVYARGRAMLAAPFDVKNLRVGGSVGILDEVGRLANTGAAQFAFSDSGTLVYLSSRSISRDTEKSLAVIDLTGKVTHLEAPRGPYANLHLSPDAKQIAVNNTSDQTIWIYDVDGRSAMRRLGLDRGRFNPVWTRDGRIVFNTTTGARGLFWQRADGGSIPEQLIPPGTFATLVPMSVSPDGTVLIFKDLRLQEKVVRVYASSLSEDHSPRQLFQVEGNNVIHATLSPDGGWLAYQWDRRSDDSNVYVEPFPPNGVRHQITINGGLEPNWSSDGRRLFYVSNEAGSRDATFWSVEIRTGPEFWYGRPERLFTLKDKLGPGIRNVDFSKANNQFAALLTAPDRVERDALHVVLNWFTELRTRVPAR